VKQAVWISRGLTIQALIWVVRLREFSNCLIYALRQFRKGGYVIMGPSKNTSWPHFKHAQSIAGVEVTEFVPANPVKRMIPPPLFRGSVRTGVE